MNTEKTGDNPEESTQPQDEAEGVLQAEPDDSSHDPAAQPRPDDGPDEEQPAPPQAPGGAKASTPGRGLGLLALLFALVAATGTGWMAWQQWQSGQQAGPPPWQGETERLAGQLDFLKQTLGEQRQQLEQLQAALDAQQQGRSQAEQQWQQQLQVLRQQLDVLQQADGRFESALVQLAQLKTGGDRAQVLMEIEFLLRTAILRAELFGDRDLALRALELAARHLDGLDDPAYVRVRMQVEAEIAALRAVAVPDLAHWLGRVTNMRQQLPDWPLKPSSEPAAVQPDDTDRAGFMQRLQALGSELVRLRRVDQAPPLPGHWQRAWHQALALQFAALESALAGGDAETVRTVARSTRQWLEQYFDGTDARVRQALTDLSLLSEMPLRVELPPVGQSLRHFRQVVAGLSGQPTPASAAGEMEGNRP